MSGTVICVCDGRYDGCTHVDPCPLEAMWGQPWGPWCAECNPRRIASVGAQFEALRQQFEEQGEPA